VRGGGHRKRPTRTQHAADLREEQLNVTYVLDGLGAEHEVEARVRQRKRRVRLELQEAGLGKARARALERDLRDVRGGELSGVQLGAQAPVAAAEIEGALGGP